MWIHNDDFEVGAVGFFAEIVDLNTGVTSYELRDRPVRTNQSREPLLYGWGGATNNVSRTARGLRRVARVNATGTRALLASVPAYEATQWLQSNGWGELR